MSAKAPGPSPAADGTYLWTCENETCQHTAPLDAYFQTDAEPKHYVCPACRQAPRVPCIELHNAKTKKNDVFFMPTPKQVEAMLCPARNLLYGGRAGTGKATAEDTLIPTPNGLVAMRDLQPGDEVLDEAGRSVKVLGKTEPHVDPEGTYRVTFSDGESVVVSANHEWLTYTYDERRRRVSRTPEWAARRRAKRASRAKSDSQKPWTRAALTARNKATGEAHEFQPVTGEVRDTKTIAATLSVRGGTHLNHAVPVADAWDLPERALPIDPYVLGAWLGDGTAMNAQITGLDPEVFAQIEAAGHEARPCKGGRSCYVHDLIGPLRDLGVLKNKHVPHTYLWASKAQRLALLQGLMDTDGYCSAKTGTVEFCNTNKSLAEAVLHLARSLGCVARMSEGRATLYGVDKGPKYRVCWTSTLRCFRLTRKLARLREKVSDSQRYRHITAVQRVADEACYCLAIDSSSHLYLCTSAGIPTHNSWWLRMEAYHRCLKVAGFRALILRRHITELRGTHLDKAAIEAKQIGAVWRASENTLVFNNGSRLRFGHVEDDNAVTNYLSEEYDWIGFDEGATFSEYAVRFISSRLRTTKKGVRPLLRMGSNPGAMWIHRYYIAKDVTAEDDPSYNPDDYAFIPASALDNPHVTEEEYNLRLNALPTEALRKMYRDGDWGAVDGQEFTEWKPFVRDDAGAVTRWHEITELPTVVDPQTHQRIPISEAPWIPVTRVLDWGYSPDPGHVTWFAHLPSGRFIAFKEWSFRETLAKDVADGIHERSGGMKVRTSIAGHDLWMKSKETGEALAETFARRRISFQVANTDRVHGWQRLHALLKETVDEGNGPVPRLQVYIGGDHGPGCTVLARTLPMLRQDPKTPGDVLQQDDHAPDTARWFAMDRPAASKTPDKPSAWSRLSADARRRITAASGKGSTLGSESVRRR